MDWLLQYTDPSLDWSYALLTLVVRFVGVFVVMFVMQVALQGASFAVNRIEGRAAAAGPSAKSPAPAVSEDLALEELDDGTLAAIGVALSLENGAGLRIAPEPSSPWRIAGRIEQMQRLAR